MIRKLMFLTIGLLFLWYSLNMIGFTFNGFNLVERSTEAIEIVVWFLLVIGIFLFFFKEKIGSVILLLILIAWCYFQFSMYFWDSFDGYYRFFSDTHHLFQPSNDFLVKDTYHIILDLLLLTSLINIIILFVGKIKSSVKSKT